MSLNSNVDECWSSLPQKRSGLEVKSYPEMVLNIATYGTIIDVKISSLTLTGGSRMDLELLKELHPQRTFTS